MKGEALWARPCIRGRTASWSWSRKSPNARNAGPRWLLCLGEREPTTPLIWCSLTTKAPLSMTLPTFELGERYLMPDGTLYTQSCLSTTR